MPDLATIRTQIKSWERSFKDTNGRAPTIQDIKEQPEIAEKYKVYKKLSKAAAAAPVASSSSKNALSFSHPPSTPPQSASRPDAHPSLLIPKPRAVETTAPLSSFNPFSPQKKGKKKDTPASTAANAHYNPFASPTKSKPKLERRASSLLRSPSPDPFPTIQLHSSSSLFGAPPPAPVSAVSRARKRLRGEPVSPSPNKEKRRRVESQTTLPFPRLDLSVPGSEDEGEDDKGEAVNSSFIDDSPVKAPIAGRPFSLLFDESIIPIGDLGGGGKGPTAVTKVNGNLFPKISDENDIYLDGDNKETHNQEQVAKGKTTKASSMKLRAESVARPKLARTKSTKGIISSSLTREASTSRTSSKRSLSDTEMEQEQDPEPSTSKPRLIPPSPAPAGSSKTTGKANTNAQAKGKGKRKASGKPTKKPKTVGKDGDDDGTDESDVDELPPKLKIVGRKAARTVRANAVEDDALGPDSDPVMNYARSSLPHVERPSLWPAGTDKAEEGKIEVDLPDKLRRMLALESADWRSRTSQEERVAKSLIYGQRVGHYDPGRGGEIWSVGEDAVDRDRETRGDTEGEEDWEGEPIPWEVGEL